MQFVVVDVAAADQAVGPANVGRGSAAAMQIKNVFFDIWVGTWVVCGGLFVVCMLVGWLFVGWMFVGSA